MLINLSNHPSSQWTDQQMQTAQQAYGDVTDLAFPQIPPSWGRGEVVDLAQTYAKELQALVNGQPSETKASAVHLMGEMSFTFALVAMLQKIGITPILSTTARNTIDHEDGSKTFYFDFVRFREYPELV